MWQSGLTQAHILSSPTVLWGAPCRPCFEAVKILIQLNILPLKKRAQHCVKRPRFCFLAPSLSELISLIPIYPSVYWDSNTPPCSKRKLGKIQNNINSRAYCCIPTYFWRLGFSFPEMNTLKNPRTRFSSKLLSFWPFGVFIALFKSEDCFN